VGFLTEFDAVTSSFAHPRKLRVATQTSAKTIQIDAIAARKMTH
jgi:hypothetical protein